MSSAQSTPMFDAEALRAGIEQRDAARIRDLYSHNARLTLVDQHVGPSNPQEMAGKAAIGEYLDELYGQEVEHRVEQVIVSADGSHASYLERCFHPDGSRVITTSMLDLRDGRITSQTSLLSSDAPSAATSAERAAAAQRIEHLDFSRPDEVRTFGHGRAEILHVGGGVVGRFMLEPGWRWSLDVKPLVGTEWCEAPHFQYQVSGTVRVHMADGMEFDSAAGDITVLPSNHDAWVIGDEPAVLVDWQGAVNYGEQV